ncbi:hypothetical protein DFJ43DRAFT_992367 [Lentinula guzmanii]|uniref:Uncharacterized protein n=1 Tax=Lentinula guzmanii TaxID=2804957 RepID=A0AA38JMR9_9AGAR|nr:hypothetical protein DFJ43DRAFT_992367 [Lentinula guzmanii]
MSIQARIPPALAALHNFILQFDPTDIEDFLRNLDVLDGEPDADHYSSDIYGQLANNVPSQEEKEEAEKRRNEIAESMWVQYQHWLLNNEILDSTV